ncbi:MAG: glycosyltransferase family 4 protein [Verrucomicrobiota bacterium]
MSTPDLFLLTHEFAPKRGGIATFAEEIARAATAAGRVVEVWAQAAREESPWPFTVRRLPMKGTLGPFSVGTSWLALFRQRRRWRDADLLLAEPGPMLAMMFVPDLTSLRPRRLLLTFHGSEILRFAANPFIRPLAERLVVRADRISVLTRHVEGLLLKHFPMAAGKVVVTGGAPRSSASPAPAAPVRRENHRVVILTVGRIHPRKGQRRMIEALSALPAELKADVEYRIVGRASRDKHEVPVRAAAAASGVDVRFVGGLSDEAVQAEYAGADLFALTSVPHGHSVEGFGLVYLEASAQGLPVVAHAIGGVPEAVQDGVTGLLVPPDDLAALTGALARLIRDPALRAALGEAGRERAASHDSSRAADILLAP